MPFVLSLYLSLAYIKAYGIAAVLHKDPYLWGWMLLVMWGWTMVPQGCWQNMTSQWSYWRTVRRCLPNWLLSTGPIPTKLQILSSRPPIRIDFQHLMMSGEWNATYDDPSYKTHPCCTPLEGFWEKGEHKISKPSRQIIRSIFVWCPCNLRNISDPETENAAN